jgi:predicted RNA-binding protein YlqC (UPF0109 family)
VQAKNNISLQNSGNNSFMISGGQAIMLKEFLENIIKPIVDKPEEVSITEVEGDSVCIYELRVAAEDFGKVIGKHGQNANAIRTLLHAVSGRAGKRGVLEILEE